LSTTSRGPVIGGFGPLRQSRVFLRPERRYDLGGEQAEGFDPWLGIVHRVVSVDGKLSVPEAGQVEGLLDLLDDGFRASAEPHIVGEVVEIDVVDVDLVVGIVDEALKDPVLLVDRHQVLLPGESQCAVLCLFLGLFVRFRHEHVSCDLESRSLRGSADGPDRLRVCVPLRSQQGRTAVERDRGPASFACEAM
jgi:hypothetical protein